MGAVVSLSQGKHRLTPTAQIWLMEGVKLFKITCWWVKSFYVLLFHKSFNIIYEQDSFVLGETSKVILVSLRLSHGRWCSSQSPRKQLCQSSSTTQSVSLRSSTFISRKNNLGECQTSSITPSASVPPARSPLCALRAHQAPAGGILQGVPLQHPTTGMDGCQGPDSSQRAGWDKIPFPPCQTTSMSLRVVARGAL